MMERQKTDHFDQASVKIVVVTASQMKEIEKKAAEAGLSYYQMMENAGIRAAEYITRCHSVEGKIVTIFCGKGNNGGDGFVVARKLKEEGASVKLILVEGEPKTEDALKNCRMCQAMSIPMYQISDRNEKLPDPVKDADLIIDAIYGTGFHGELREPVRKITRQINASDAIIYALDIPSGLSGDSGMADSDTVKAKETIVFHRLKPAHALENTEKYCGQVTCISIGIEEVLPDIT